MPRIQRAGLSIFLVTVIFVSGFAFGSLRPASEVAAAPAKPPVTDETLTLFTPFWEAWNLMHRSYVDPLNDDLLMEGAISGMMQAVLDQHTNYFDPELYKSINDEMTGQFTGIGASIRKDDKTGALIVVSTLPGSPARKSGLIPGDVIVSVDGVNVELIPQTKVISRIRGEAGTTLILGILRNGEPPMITLQITRDLIVMPTVVTRMYPGNIGYIALAEFNDKASREFSRGLRQLRANRLSGLVLDLRGNPGGYLTTAIDVTSQFIDEGNVVIERDKGGAIKTFPVHGDAYAPDVPMVVLVDGGSASASELVTGALQDYGRATVIGSQTYGKGSVQIVEPLSNGGAAHITIARWYTPLDRSIQGIGITPDMKVTWDAYALPDRDLQLEQALLVLRGEF